jgi:hypothetical protein
LDSRINRGDEMIKGAVVLVQCDACKKIDAIDLQDIDMNEFFIEIDKAGWWWKPIFVCPKCQKEVEREKCA